MKKRKPNLERLYMMHSLKEALKISRRTLADGPLTYATVLSKADRRKLERATAVIGDLHMKIHKIIEVEHRELDEGGHTQPSEAA